MKEIKENNKDLPRLVIVSNRFPFVIEKDEQGKLSLKGGSGGLTTALAPVLRNRGGVWIGWTGSFDIDEKEVASLFEKSQKEQGFLFAPVFLTREDVNDYYKGFSNEIVWPLFHDLQAHCHFVPEYWQAYESVNKKFADVVCNHLLPHDFIWVHDYHLMLLGQELRKTGHHHKIGFFLHTPFPPLDIFLKIPWRFQIISALLQYDLIGFQTARDKRNFVQCIKALFKDIKMTYARQMHVCAIEQRKVRIGAFAISIDFDEFNHMAMSSQVVEKVRAMKKDASNQKIVFSVDRLDYTKGILFRLEAIRRFLKTYPEHHNKIQFIQLVIPSREEIPKYHQLKEEIERLIGEVNGQFTQDGWVPIHHLYRSFNREELIAHYRASDVLLITPVKDGMNLVCKEYIASNVDESGVVILSEFAGSAAQLYEKALLINPYDIEGVVETLHKAIKMPLGERKKRMKKMRRDVKKYDIFWWVKNFLHAAIAKELKDFPLVEEFLPNPHIDSL